MNETLRDMIYFAIAGIFVKFLGAFTYFFVAKVLTPADYGVWITLTLIGSYSTILCLGTVETLVKQYPYYIGRNEIDNANMIEDSVLGSIAISAVSLIIIGFTFLLFTSNDEILRLASYIRLVIFTGAVAFFSAFYYYRFIAHQNFKIVSFINMARGTLSFILLVIFSWKWGLIGAITGFFLGELIISVLSSVLSHKYYGKSRFNFNLKLIWNLIKIGFPITIIWWVFTLQSTVDRVVSMSMLGKSATGYYGLGMSIVATLVLIPDVVGQVLYPKINEGVGKAMELKQLSSLVIMPSRALSLVLPFFLGLAVLLSPMVYKNLFPKYLPGLLSAQILFLGCFFVCLIRNGVNYLIAINKQNRLLIYAGVSLGIKIVISIILVRANFGIEGIASSTVISSLILTSMIWLSVFKNMGYSLFDQLKEIIVLYSPFVLLVLVLGSLRFTTSNLFTDTSIGAAYKSVIFLFLFFVIIFYMPPFSLWVKGITQTLKIKFGKQAMI